jgi:hypothetical protein
MRFMRGTYVELSASAWPAEVDAVGQFASVGECRGWDESCDDGWCNWSFRKSAMAWWRGTKREMKEK